jgi:DNA-binding response OmpR family regulator
MQLNSGQGWPSTSPAASLPVADTRAAGPLDILVVEDDDRARRALELALGHMGHLVIGASSAAEAAALLGAFKVDLVISDHALPDGTCENVLKALRNHAPRVPTIAVSGNNSETLKSEMLAAGFDAWLSKPMDMAHLQRAACQVLGRPL